MLTIVETTLVRTPGVCGGKLRIDGTRMTVNQIVTLYKQGNSPEQIADAYERFSRREVYAVLAWYQEHQQEFDAELAAEAAADQAAIDEIAASGQ
jgi:uncharacterized protein (DUF433 family)